MNDDQKPPVSPAAETTRDKWPGTVLAGRYRIDVLLGSGSMGRVYRAEHVHMHKPLAVKILNSEHTKNAELVARFEREATAAANIEHPNVVAATDFGKLDDGTVYLALELVQGKNLRAEVASGPLEVRRALHIARQIAAGLAAAHARNIVHRDLKPENVVLVEKEGDRDFVKILDFGVAKLEPESGKSPLTKVGVVLGTFDYMAPEQALGQAVDHRADLYALGAVAYEMLSGTCPFEGESSSAILAQKVAKAPPPLRERSPTLAIPGAVEGLVLRLLRKDRSERPQSAASVVAELDRLLASAPKGGAPASAPARPPRPGTPPATAVTNKPTFLPTDPLPAFTFPPLEEESKKLAHEVRQAVAARPGASSSPSVDGLLANLPVTTPLQEPKQVTAVSSSPSVDALLAGSPPASGDLPVKKAAETSPSSARTAELLMVLRTRAARVAERAIVWLDDNRRFLPRFIKRPIRRLSSRALLVSLLVVLVALLVTIVLVASGSDERSGAKPAPAGGVG
jgi:serine/threonine-protein kinase